MKTISSRRLTTCSKAHLGKQWDKGALSSPRNEATLIPRHLWWLPWNHNKLLGALTLGGFVVGFPLLLVANIGGTASFPFSNFRIICLLLECWAVLHKMGVFAYFFWFSNIWILFLVVTVTSHGSSLNLYSTFCLRFWWNVFFWVETWTTRLGSVATCGSFYCCFWSWENKQWPGSNSTMYVVPMSHNTLPYFAWASLYWYTSPV